MAQAPILLSVWGCMTQDLIIRGVLAGAMQIFQRRFFVADYRTGTPREDGVPTEVGHLPQNNGPRPGIAGRDSGNSARIAVASPHHLALDCVDQLTLLFGLKHVHGPEAPRMPQWAPEQ